MLWLRGLKAIYFGTIFNCVVLAMVLFAALAITEPILRWSEWLPAPLFEALRVVVALPGFTLVHGGSDPDFVRTTNNVLSIASIVTVTFAYATTGGLRGVVRTDLVQLAVMFLGMGAYAAAVVSAAGGLDALVARVADPAFRGPGGLTGAELVAFGLGAARDAGAAVLAVLALQWLVQMNADGTGYLAQRAMACRSDRDARVAGVVMTGLQILVRSWLWLPIGVGLVLLLPPDAALEGDVLRADRETSFVRGVVAFLPPGVSGLVWTALLAALASTLDTHLNWGASYWTRDLYERIYCEHWRGRPASPRTLVRVARASNAIVLAIAIALLPFLGSIQTAWTLSLMLGSGMGVVLLLRWLWWRVNAWSEIAAIVASTLLAPVLLVFVDGEAVRLLALAATATAAAGIAAFATTPDPPEALQRFVDRVSPPGFWGAYDRNGSGAARLGRGVVATALAALGTFVALVSVGTAMLHTLSASMATLRITVGVAFAIACVAAAWSVSRGSDSPSLGDTES